MSMFYIVSNHFDATLSLKHNRPDEVSFTDTRYSLSRTRLLAVLLLIAQGVLVCSDARAENWAIVVGINDYPEFRLPDGAQPPALRGAETDADAIARRLVEDFAFPEAHVVLLKGRRATHSRVKQAFEDVARQARATDLFVFHFSGHGTRVADRKPFDEPDGVDEALCLADATDKQENLLVDDDLALWLDAIPARRITIILDCCHAGTGIKGSDDDIAARYLPIPESAGTRLAEPEIAWRELRGVTKDIGRQLTAFYACKAEQQAYERRFPHLPAPARAGQFTQAMLAGLEKNAADADGDGKVTSAELLRFAALRLDETFNKLRDRPDERQEPLLESDDAEALPFGTINKK